MPRLSIAASRAVAAGSPAYYTLAWHRLRLLIGETSRRRPAPSSIKSSMAADLPEGVENLMRYHAMKLARDLDEFLRFALRRGEFVMYLSDPRTKLRRDGAAVEAGGPCRRVATTLQMADGALSAQSAIFR